MPPAGDPSASLQLAGLYSDNVELTHAPSYSESYPQGFEEDIYPDSNSSILRRHRYTNDSDDEIPNASTPSLFGTIRSMMSRSPLLDSKRKSYATLSGGSDGQSERQQEERGRTNRTSRNSQQSRKGTVSLNVSRGSLNASSSQVSLTPGVEVPVGHGTIPEAFSPIEEQGQEEEAVIDVDVDSRYDERDPPDNSMYPQVKAWVSAVDNVDRSISTPRMWILSLLFAFLGSATNMFFSLRYPSVAITPVIALILVHPLGRIWDMVLKRDDDPKARFENGRLVHSEAEADENAPWYRRWRLWLAQGHWNEKEHACVYISSNVSFGFAFATDVIVEQKKFYKQDVDISYQLLLTISTQILGYAFAGITRRYLVRPPSMIWPGILMSTSMFTTMHNSENKVANGWKVSRWHFFISVWAGGFAWYFLPGLLVPALSYFNVITWMAPDNVVASNLFGVVSGLGLFPLTFDWAQLAYIGSPLVTPWPAAANVFAGLAIVMWIIAPILYYKNALYSAFMPILSASVFDNTGKPYDVSKILTADFLFDEEAFKNYSPIYMPITYVLSYAVQFASLTALVTHTVCWHGKDIWEQTKESFGFWSEKEHADYQPLAQASTPTINGTTTHNNQSSPGLEPELGSSMSGGDVHNRLMQRYEDAPISWYLLTLCSMLAVGIFVVEYYPVYLPFYGLLLALGITTVMFLPIAIIMAITNQHSSLYLVGQLICGYVFPGRPVANMVFVTYCYISSAQGVKFSSDLKLGHYMKIPPKILFAVQMVATLVSSLTQVGVLNWMFVNVPGICTPEALNGFTCPLARVHFNGSILWGVVGPHRFFGAGALYRNLIWAFLVGAIAPAVAWFFARKSEKGILRRINLPVMLNSLSWMPPATGLNFSGWALVCFIFNYIVPRRAFKWWGKYTMTMSAALDSGLVFGVLVVFFGFKFSGIVDNFHWWGTEVYKQGCDWKACAYLQVPKGGHFGPA